MGSFQIIEVAGNGLYGRIRFGHDNALLKHTYGSSSQASALISSKRKIEARRLLHRRSERPCASPRCQGNNASGDPLPSNGYLVARLDRRHLLLASSVGFAGLPFVDAREALGAPVHDDNSNLVRVRIGDALDTTKLAYQFEAVSNDWLNRRPSSATGSGSRASAALTRMDSGPGGGPPAAMAGLKDKIKEKIEEFKERKSKKLEGIVNALVKRPKKVKADDYEEEILLIEGVEVPTDQKVKFDVFVNLLEANAKTGAGVSEYAGSFYNLPHVGKFEGKSKARKSNFRIGIGEVLRELGIEDDDSFVVTIVPQIKGGIPISINDIKLEYE